MWLDGEEVLAQTLLLDHLLPLAESGLRRAGVDEGAIGRYLGILDKRVRTLHTGSRWMLDSLASMKNRGNQNARLTALTAAMIARQKTDAVVADWPLARFEENDSQRTTFHKVSQHMTTDVFTVCPDDPVELVDKLMQWERIRYVLVEDEKGRLVGLVTQRAILRHLTDAVRGGMSLQDAESVPVSSIMRRELITVTPDTRTSDATALLRSHRIGCLPVVQDGYIVAVVTEEDFVNLASKVIDADTQGEGSAEP
jgi:CBS domain-containing protein